MISCVINPKTIPINPVHLYECSTLAGRKQWETGVCLWIQIQVIGIIFLFLPQRDCIPVRREDSILDKTFQVSKRPPKKVLGSHVVGAP